MRTIEEVLKRDDYKRLSSELSDMVADIAKSVRKKMEQLDLKELGDYVIVLVNSNSGYWNEYLSVKDNVS